MAADADVVVVGGGPAGLTAALVLGRARRRVVLVDDGTYRNGSVEEFHGFPGRDAGDPSVLRADVRRELANYGVEVVERSAEGARSGSSSLTVGLAGDGTITARSMVIATGVRDELPAIEGVSARWGVSVFNCPFCDAWEHRDLPLVVLAAAPGAEQLASLLRSWTEQVRVVEAHDVRRLVGRGAGVEAVEMTDGTLVPAAAVFVRAPVRPRSGLAADLGCALDEDGFVVTDDQGATSHPLVWAAGDVRRAPPRPHQVVLAAADGSAAAIALHKALAA